LGLARRERRLGLSDLIRHLTLLKAKRRFGLADLRREPLDVLRVVRGVGLQLVRLEERDQLIALRLIALLHEQLFELSRDLGADDDVVGRDDPRERQRRRRTVGVAVTAPARGGDYGKDEERSNALHGVKHMYKT